jgi:hypothetical protein
MKMAVFQKVFPSVHIKIDGRPKPERLEDCPILVNPCIPCPTALIGVRFVVAIAHITRAHDVANRRPRRPHLTSAITPEIPNAEGVAYSQPGVAKRTPGNGHHLSFVYPERVA